MNRKIRFWIALAGFGFLIAGCDIVNPPEEIPAYLTIRNPVVELDENTGFTSEIGLKDVWLYHSGFLQGAYSIANLPNREITVPYLDVADTSFFMLGGIQESGQSAFRLPYPFWQRINFQVEQSGGDTAVIQPVFKYLDDTRVETKVEENFEGASIQMVPFSTSITQDDSTHFRRRRTDPYMGDFSGYVPFGVDDRYFETINANSFTLSRENNIYAEITYRSSVNFTVGFVYQGQGGVSQLPVLTVTPSGEWNTVYVHLVDQVRTITNQEGDFTSFWLWIKADGEGNDGYINFDNIRLMHEK